MPFVVTCPQCAARFRSANERPVGKGVECPKCGEQFHVSAANQVEFEAAPPPAAPRPREDDADAPRPTDDVVVPDARPRRRARVYVLMTLAGLMFWGSIGGGVALYLLMDDGWFAPDPRPQRPLPDDMFAFIPNPAYSVKYTDYAQLRDLGDPTAGESLQYVLPKEAGITTDQVLAICTAQASLAQSETVTLVSFTGPQDLVAVAGRCKFTLLPNNGRLYVGKSGFEEWAVSQPAPTKLLFFKAKSGGTLAGNKVLNLANLDPYRPNLTDEMRDGLTVVSGYPRIEGHTGRTGPDSLGLGMSQFSGYFTNTDRVKEWYSFQHFLSPATAAGWGALGVVPGKARTKPEGELARYEWRRGDKRFMFQRNQQKP